MADRWQPRGGEGEEGVATSVPSGHRITFLISKVPIRSTVDYRTVIIQ